MSFKGVLTCLALIYLATKNVEGAPDKVVCYAVNWAEYRLGDGHFALDQIPADLCTHLMYSFVTAENNDIKLLDSNVDIDKGMMAKFNDLKKINPSLKTLVAMGGWNAGSSGYSAMFSNANNRQTFAKNAVTFLKKYGFDGLDLDWEYPGQRGGAPADKQNFVELCKALKEEFAPEGFLLSAAVGATENMISLSYDVSNMAKHLDFINLMTYDLHTGGALTGHNAPLYMSNSETVTANAALNVKACVDAWIKNGAPSNKLVLGMPLYGHSYTLASQSCNTPGCSSSATGKAGSITQQAGFLGYNEICQNLRNEPNANVGWDDEAKVPYYSSGDQWVSFDNQQSYAAKLDFIESYNLGGAMVWSMETDDFNGLCGQGKYPLITELKNRIMGSSYF